jgi:hypothetical protein
MELVGVCFECDCSGILLRRSSEFDTVFGDSSPKTVTELMPTLTCWMHTNFHLPVVPKDLGRFHMTERCVLLEFRGELVEARLRLQWKEDRMLVTLSRLRLTSVQSALPSLCLDVEAVPLDSEVSSMRSYVRRQRESASPSTELDGAEWSRGLSYPMTAQISSSRHVNTSVVVIDAGLRQQVAVPDLVISALLRHFCPYLCYHARDDGAMIFSSRRSSRHSGWDAGVVAAVQFAALVSSLFPSSCEVTVTQGELVFGVAQGYWKLETVKTENALELRRGVALGQVGIDASTWRSYLEAVSALDWPSVGVTEEASLQCHSELMHYYLPSCDRLKQHFNIVASVRKRDEIWRR